MPAPVGKVLKMPKRGSVIEGKVPASNDEAEHIVRYPRLREGNHFAEIIRDRRVYPEVYHCVIQREGSNEIHGWTQHSSIEAARQSAETALSLFSAATESK